VTARQVAEAEISDPPTDEMFHVVTDLVKHTTNLAINALMQHNAYTRGRNRMEPLDAGAFAVQKKSFR